MAELYEWVAFDQIYPLPDPCWIGAMMTSSLVNIQIAKGKRTKLEDYLPTRRVWKPRYQETPEERSVKMLALGRRKRI